MEPEMENKTHILCRKFSLTLISAENLPNVRKRFKSKVYAKVTFGGEEKTEKRTPVNKHGDLNPAWNYTVRYKIAERGIVNQGLRLVIKFYCERTLGDRYIGECYTDMKQLFDHAYSQGGSATISLPINKGCEKTGANLSFSYRFEHPTWVKKPSLLKKAALSGAEFMLRMAGIAIIGVDIRVSLTDYGIIDVDKVNEDLAVGEHGELHAELDF